MFMEVQLDYFGAHTYDLKSEGTGEVKECIPRSPVNCSQMWWSCHLARVAAYGIVAPIRFDLVSQTYFRILTAHWRQRKVPDRLYSLLETVQREILFLVHRHRKFARYYGRSKNSRLDWLWTSLTAESPGPSHRTACHRRIVVAELGGVG